MVTSVLNKEIASIHKLPGWDHVPIVIVGHSLGGLIAYTWWQNFGLSNSLGVVDLFALDAPINGIGNAYQCIGGRIQISLCPLAQLAGKIQYSNSVFSTFEDNWNNLIVYDETSVSHDTGQGSPYFVPIGTVGDTTYDSTADNVTDGLVSQVFMKGCQESGTVDPDAPGQVSPPFNYGCSSTSGASITSPCPVSSLLADKGFGHLLVKICPGVVDDIRTQVFGS